MTILIDGPVGVGKTSLSEIVSEKFGLRLFKELSDPLTEEILDLYYPNKARWAFPTQIHFLTKRAEMEKEAAKLDGAILDRSIFGDNVFAEMLMEDHVHFNKPGMTALEYRIYGDLINQLLQYVKKPDLLIYLQCTPETAKRRIDKRNRGSESKVDMEYWVRLNEKYDIWFEEYDHSPKLLIRVDEIDFVNNVQDREGILAVIEKALNDLGIFSLA